MPRHNLHKTFGAENGVVIVMVLIIALVLTMGATAFMVLSNVETRALNYKTAVVRAEQAADSGLSRATAVIDKVTKNITDHPNLVATPDGIWDTDTNALATGDLSLSWATDFQNSSGRIVIPTAEFDPYGADEYTSGATTFTTKGTIFKIQTAGKDSGDYAVLIADMDGRLHTNPLKWSVASGTNVKDIYQVITDALGLSAKLDDLAGTDTSSDWHSLGELFSYCTLDSQQQALLRPYLTPYPIPATNPAPAHININTARSATIEAVLKEIKSFDSDAVNAVKNQLISKRPFVNRSQLESAIEELAPQHKVIDVDGNTIDVGILDPDDVKALTEEQFNDVLNSLNYYADPLNPSNQSLFCTDADFSLGDRRTAIFGKGGEYAFNFDPPPPPVPPPTPPYEFEPPFANTGGKHTAPLSDTTWGCEVQFKSRYYEILVLGRGWRLGSDPDAGRGRAAERLLWAIYDSSPDNPANRKVIWRRWLFPADR